MFEDMDAGACPYLYGDRNFDERKLRILVGGTASVMVPVHPSFMLDKV